MSLKIHFLNVGHGDCTMLEHPSGRLSIIDINNSRTLPELDEEALAASQGITLSQFRVSKSATTMSWEEYYQGLLVDPFDYYSSHFAGRSIWRYIQSHPDMDHMTGLCRFFWQGEVPLANFWDTEHEKDFDEDTFDKSRYDWNDWLVYKRLKDGHVQDGDDHKVLHKYRDAVGEYWTEDKLSVLSPTAELLDYCNRVENWNNSSYILRVEHGGRSVILPGDAEKPAWDSAEADLDPDLLQCDILKAAHHGRESGYSESAVDIMSPDVVICSVGKKPETDASDEYASHGAKVLSTRYNGTIVVTIFDDGEVVAENHKGEVISSLPALY